MSELICSIKAGWKSKHSTYCGAISAVSGFMSMHSKYLLDVWHWSPMVVDFFGFVAAGGLAMLGLLAGSGTSPCTKPEVEEKT